MALTYAAKRTRPYLMRRARTKNKYFKPQFFCYIVILYTLGKHLPVLLLF